MAIAASNAQNFKLWQFIAQAIEMRRQGVDRRTSKLLGSWDCRGGVGCTRIKRGSSGAVTTT